MSDTITPGNLVAAGRATLAAGLRYQAMTLRSTAELMLSQARTLESQADGIEDGTVMVPVRPARLEVVEDEPADEEAAGVVERAAMKQEGGRLMWRGADGERLSEGMLEFLTRFDARITAPCEGRPFIDAVNMAAEDCMPLNDQTAAWVAEKARELRAREEQG